MDVYQLIPNATNPADVRCRAKTDDIRTALKRDGRLAFIVEEDASGRRVLFFFPSDCDPDLWPDAHGFGPIVRFLGMEHAVAAGTYAVPDATPPFGQKAPPAHAPRTGGWTWNVPLNGRDARILEKDAFEIMCVADARDMERFPRPIVIEVPDACRQSPRDIEQYLQFAINDLHRGTTERARLIPIEAITFPPDQRMRASSIAVRFLVLPSS